MIPGGEYESEKGMAKLHCSLKNFGLCVITGGSSAIGEAFVKLAPGVTVKPGNTLVASAQGGCAEVDNAQMDLDRIIGWALEKSGQTTKGYVFVVLK